MNIEVDCTRLVWVVISFDIRNREKVAIIRTLPSLLADFNSERGSQSQEREQARRLV
jgi:hypothetical protein